MRGSDELGEGDRQHPEPNERGWMGRTQPSNGVGYFVRVNPDEPVSLLQLAGKISTYGKMAGKAPISAGTICLLLPSNTPTLSGAMPLGGAFSDSAMEVCHVPT